MSELERETAPLIVPRFPFRTKKFKVHTDEEMSIALEAGARVIGVNNRNLHTFELDLDTTERVSRVALKHDVPWQAGMDGQGKDRIVLSALSGITGPNDVKR